MARLVTCGFEMQQLNPGTAGAAEGEGFSTLLSPSISTSTVRTGSAAGSVGNSGYFDWAFTGVTGRNYYARAYFRFSALPSSAVTIFYANAFTPALRLRTDGTLILLDQAFGQVGAASQALSANTWYRLEVQWNTPSAGNGTVGFRVNGNDVVSAASANIGTTAATSMQWGNILSTTTGVSLFFDDIALNDDQGAAQNTWPGDGSIRYLLPISDNARTGWTAGAGGTTNLWDAINNAPPTGVAVGSGTDTSQIKDANNNSTDNYDVNMQTYSTGGITSADLITVVAGLIQMGGNNGSFTTNVAVGLQSNPTIAETNVPTNVAAGSSPASWVAGRTAYSYLPTTALGSSPVLRIGRRSSNSVTATVDYAAVVVEYIPNGALVPVAPNRYVSRLQAVQRAANW